MKKFFALLLSIAMVLTAVLVFAGCRGTTLVVYNFRPEDQDYYEYVNKAFEKEYDVKVSYSAVDTNNYETVVQGALTGGKVDVFGTQPQHFSSDAYLQYMSDLSELAIWDKIDDTAVSECKIGGVPYIMPISSASEVVFYNKDIFTECGITIPTTWDEFVNVCETLTGKVGKTINGTKLEGVIMYGGKDGWPVNMILCTLEANIVRTENPDILLELALGTYNETQVKTLFTDVFDKIRTISKYFQSGALGTEYAFAPRNFALGKAAMMIDGSWSLGQILEVAPEINLGAFVMPGNIDASKNTKVPKKTSCGWAITKNAPQKELAQKYLEFMMREDIYTKYLNDTKLGSVHKTIKNQDALCNEIFSMDSVLVFDNMFVTGWNMQINNVIGPGLVTNTMKGSEAAQTMLNGINEGRETWSGKNLENWLNRFYPEQLN